eukprot:2162642-Prymnesium_polylepis.1
MSWRASLPPSHALPTERHQPVMLGVPGGRHAGVLPLTGGGGIVWVVRRWPGEAPTCTTTPTRSARPSCARRAARPPSSTPP